MADFLSSSYGLTSAGVISLAVSLIIALLTHRRATKADNNRILLDRQTVINDAYQSVLDQIQEELSRRDIQHQKDRDAWETKEKELLERINRLEGELKAIKEDRNFRQVHIEEAHVDKLSGPGFDTSD